MPSTTYEMVAKAIEQKARVTGTYNGYHRVMCPHALGYSKSGEEQALFYQVGGESSKGLGPVGSPENWRCIPLAKLEDAHVVSGEWHTAPNHSRPQSCVADVRVEVHY